MTKFVACRNVGQPNAGADRLAPRRRSDLASGGAVTQDQLTAPQHGVRIIDPETDELAARALGFRLFDGLATEERDIGLELAREQQPRPTPNRFPASIRS